MPVFKRRALHKPAPILDTRCVYNVTSLFLNTMYDQRARCMFIVNESKAINVPSQ